MTLELRNTPQQARSESTLAALTAAARHAAETIGYDRFTTTDVAEIAGRSIGTVYRYFPDRVALLDAIDPGRTVAADVRAERVRQDAKWGEQNHPDGTGGEAAVRQAEWAKRRTDQRAEEGTVNWLLILREEVLEAFAESDPAKLRAELVQVAAVAQQWAEAIDRRDS